MSYGHLERLSWVSVGKYDSEQYMRDTLTLVDIFPVRKKIPYFGRPCFWAAVLHRMDKTWHRFLWIASSVPDTQTV